MQTNKLLYFILLLNWQILFSQSTVTFKVFFKTDSFNVNNENKQKLCDFIQKYNTKINTISVNGFCDDRGTNSYNYKLAENRVNSIVKIADSLLKNQNVNVIKNVIGEIPLNNKYNKETERNKNRKVTLTLNLKAKKLEPLKKQNTTTKKREIHPNRKSSIFSIQGQRQIESRPLKMKDVDVSYSAELQHHFSKVFNNNQKFKKIIFCQALKITKESYQYLYNLALFLKNNENYTLKLKGYHKYNENKLKLIKKEFGIRAKECQILEDKKYTYLRAKLVYDFLIKNGVKPENLSYAGLGYKKTVENNFIFVEIEKVKQGKTALKSKQLFDETKHYKDFFKDIKKDSSFFVTIFFKPSSFEIDNESVSELNNLLHSLKKHKNISILIEAFSWSRKDF